MHYRAEIDGLRAIAVMPVILFHAGFDTFQGGYTGVDVFFVISGYLITSILLAELEQGRFSLRHFYERRVRRLLPALGVVLLASTGLAWLLLLPGDMRDYSRDLLGVVLFASNFVFWSTTDYWSTGSDLNPLLHTWSLAVEEQFYLLYPLLLALLWKYCRRALLPVLALISVASLALSQWSVSQAPMAGYYLLPGRAWELLLGALIGLTVVPGILPAAIPVRPLPGVVRELAALTGLVLILWSIVFLDRSVPFPGIAALPPTLGAALVLVFASRATLAGRMLTWRPLVSVGLLSYSAYLWHQPLLAFLRHGTTGAPETGAVVAVIAATFILAYLTWLLVEVPFRRGRVISGKPLFEAALACSLACVAVGIAGQKTYGFINRSAGADVYLSWAAKTGINYGLHETCDGLVPEAGVCATSAEPELLVWGDSYAMHLVPGILAANPAVGLVQMTRSSCAPFLDLAAVDATTAAQPCLEFNRQVAEQVVGRPSLRYAVLSSPFSGYFSEASRLQSRDGRRIKPDRQRVDAEFRKTLDFLVANGITPIVFSPPPTNGGANIGRCLGRAEYFRRSLDACNFSLDSDSPERQQVFDWLRSLSEDFPVVFLDRLLCQGNDCRAHDGNVYYFRDSGHLSVAGARLLGQQADFYGLITATTSPALARYH